MVSQSLRIAGDKLNEDIINFARDEYNLLLGERTAEKIKIEIGSALPLTEPQSMPMRGRDLISGLPSEVMVSDKEIRGALAPSVEILINAIKVTVEQTPPELLADIMERGIVLAGGGSLLQHFDELVRQETQMPVGIADDPLTAVVRGTGVVLEDIDKLKEVLVEMDDMRPPR